MHLSKRAKTVILSTCLGLAASLTLLDFRGPAAFAESPRPVPSPSSPVSLEACRARIQNWMSDRREAQAALEACSLHKFNTICSHAAETRLKVIAPDSPCKGIEQVKESKFPEMNCTIVNVPESCGKE